MEKQGDASESHPRRILVVLPTWVGDFVMATPFLRELRRTYSNAEITFLMESNLRDLARNGLWGDHIIEWPARKRRTPLHRAFWSMVGELRRIRFDWAILLPNSFRSALVARMSGARRRFGYDRSGRGWLLTDRLPAKNRQGGRFVPTPLVDYYADFLERICGSRCDDRLELFTDPVCDGSVRNRLEGLGVADRAPLVVISPGARYGASKLWEGRKFAETADQLADEHEAVVLITCGPGEEEIARAISEHMKSNHHVMWKPLLSLGELKSLIRRADLLLCTDAGPRHIGKAFGVPVVSVFGPTDPRWTSTNYVDERVVRIDVDCGPCQQRVCPLGHHKCMRDLPVSLVVEASNQLLARRTATV